MNRTIIKLCYRKIINAQSVKTWDKLVFEASYAEYRMQVQNYEQFRSYPAYSDLVYHVPGAQQLSQRVTPAIAGYMQQLNHLTADVIDNLGRRFLRFEHFKFEIINSHFEQKDHHQVAVNFFSEPLVWHHTINNFMLISAKAQSTADEIPTYLMQVQPYLSICSLQEEQL